MEFSVLQDWKKESWRFLLLSCVIFNHGLHHKIDGSAVIQQLSTNVTDFILGVKTKWFINGLIKRHWPLKLGTSSILQYNDGLNIVIGSKNNSSSHRIDLIFNPLTCLFMFRVLCLLLVVYRLLQCKSLCDVLSYVVIKEGAMNSNAAMSRLAITLKDNQHFHIRPFIYRIQNARDEVV
jgi:hypothetical protein